MGSIQKLWEGLSAWRGWVLAAAVGVAGTLIAVFAPLPIPFRTDFIMLYSANLGLVNGIGFYDYPAQAALLSQLVGDLLGSVTIPYYVYPPWLAYGTVFLGWFPVDIAARLWFLINLGMVMTAIHLVTTNWQFKHRVVAYVFGLISLPSLGFLVVGQFVAPVLLGTALLLSGVRQQSAMQVASGMLLLTVKPHVGAGIFLVAALWLIIYPQGWKKKSIAYLSIGMALLLIISFTIEPPWPLNYLSALNDFRALSTFGVCEICSSVSVLGVSIFIGRSDTNYALLPGFVFLIIIVLWVFLRPTHNRMDLSVWVYWALTATLLSNPYLNNYDYVMLVLPTLLIYKKFPGWQGLAFLLSVFLLPWVGLAIGMRLGVAYGLALGALVVTAGLVLANKRIDDA